MPLESKQTDIHLPETERKIDTDSYQRTLDSREQAYTSPLVPSRDGDNESVNNELKNYYILSPSH